MYLTEKRIDFQKTEQFERRAAAAEVFWGISLRRQILRGWGLWCVYVCMYVCMEHDSVHNFDPIELKFGMEMYFVSDSVRIARSTVRFCR